MGSDEDVKNVSTRALRHNIGVLSPGMYSGFAVYIFDSSVYDNIIYGQEFRAAEDVQEAARCAGLHDIIVNLWGGYEASLCRSGKYGKMPCVIHVQGGKPVPLSRRLICKIAMARAYLRHHSFLLIDEPTGEYGSGVLEDTLSFIKMYRNRNAERKDGEKFGMIMFANSKRMLELVDRVIILDKNGSVLTCGHYRNGNLLSLDT